MHQVDVILRHQRDGHAVPACRGSAQCSECPTFARVCASTSVSQCVTRPRGASHPVDVGLREAGGVVVDDDLNCWNIQTTAEEHKVSSTLAEVGQRWLEFSVDSHKLC